MSARDKLAQMRLALVDAKLAFDAGDTSKALDLVSLALTISEEILTDGWSPKIDQGGLHGKA